MYYPVQIPFILDPTFSQSMQYTETAATECGGFVICFWEMQPLSDERLFVENIVVADACIDLIVSYDDHEIGFTGMSKTNFNFKLKLPKRYIGARLMPGAFHQLTGLPAAAAMDSFLPVEAAFKDFNRSILFALPFEQATQYFKSFLALQTQNKLPGLFTGLFDALTANTPATTKDLYQRLHFSPRQCQRLFTEHYGITPKMSLSIVRFQKCLEILTSRKATPADILNVAGYYDQPHFINDFKRNIGITPLELLRRYHT